MKLLSAIVRGDAKALETFIEPSVQSNVWELSISNVALTLGEAVDQVISFSLQLCSSRFHERAWTKSCTTSSPLCFSC